MKHRYDIKINPPQPSSEQIQQHRDFDALMQAFEQQPQVQSAQEASANWTVQRGKKNKQQRLRYVLYALSTVAAGILLFVALRQSTAAVEPFPVPTEQMAELIDLRAPLPHIEQRFERATITDAAKGEVLQYPSGSEVVVPAAAFVDAEGQPVEGAVEIEYREFADAVDMFLAGVPQQLDKHQNLQSTGMMEIKGFQNGKPVYLNLDKKLDINLRGRMAADTDPQELGVYAYSAQKDAWEYQSADRIERLGATNNGSANTDPTPPVEAIDPVLIRKAEDALADNKPQAPLKPGIGDDMQVFNFDLDEEDFPELAAYAGNVEFIGKKTDLTPATFDTIWNEMELVNLGNNEYLLKLTYETDEVSVVRTFDVYPALAATPEARAQYQAEKKQYQADLEAWNTEVMALAAQEAPAAIDSIVLVDIVNHFSIHRFGLWNCGKPVEWNQALPIEAQFINEEGVPLAVEQVFVTTPAQQLYYSAPSQATNTAQLKYAKTEATPTIWAMSADGALWVANTPAAPADDQATTISLKGVSVPQSERDFRTLLTF